MCRVQHRHTLSVLGRCFFLFPMGYASSLEGMYMYVHKFYTSMQVHILYILKYNIYTQIYIYIYIYRWMHVFSCDGFAEAKHIFTHQQFFCHWGNPSLQNRWPKVQQIPTPFWPLGPEHGQMASWASPHLLWSDPPSKQRIRQWIWLPLLEHYQGHTK